MQLRKVCENSVMSNSYDYAVADRMTAVSLSDYASIKAVQCASFVTF